MPNTVLEAIRLGLWNYEPPERETEDYDSCPSMPGTPDKLRALADRVRKGLPLWHPEDRQDCEDDPH